MFGQSCASCNSTDLESDPSRGDTFCTKCGAVLEENLIVSELQFEEGSHGAANLIGRMVSSDANYKSLSSGTFGNSLAVNSRESREITLANAKDKIKRLGQILRLNQHCIATAFNFYKMALSRRLTYGRKQNNVFAACLYMTCRVEGTSHMLLDLSDATAVNIFELGKTYLKLSNALCINIPPIDPCIYIVRFSNRLHKLIGTDNDKVRDIEMTALRLVQRMKRDWIHTGRRPSGLCGAALLVACRLNSVHCNIRDIIKIVQVCETTIRKRLSEFGDTETGRLTLDEFMTVDLEGEEDPPCFKEARKKHKMILQNLDSPDHMEEFQQEITKFQEMIDDKLEDIRLEKHKKYKSMMMPSVISAPKTSKKNKRKTRNSRDSLSEDEETEIDEANIEVLEEVIVGKLIETETANIVNRVLDGKDSNENNLTALERLDAMRPTAESLRLPAAGLNNFDVAANACRELSIINSSAFLDDEIIDEEEQGELDLTGISDDEIDSYILSTEERIAKEDLWKNVHAEYIEEERLKEEKRKEEEAERKKKGYDAGPPVKKKRTARKKAPVVAISAGEAIEKMLHEKRISSKINYEVLKNLNPSNTTVESIVTDVD